MWTGLPTAENPLRCGPPFSFYFDLIEVYWRARGNNLPLHRLCTLARKQGAQFVLVEDALPRAEIKSELDTLDAACGGNGSAEAISFSFFSVDIDVESLEAVDARSFLGQAVLINYKPSGASEFSTSYIFEAIIPPPSRPDASGGLKPLLNNFLYVESEFQCQVRGKTFDVSGVYYCQQNSSTHVCAHASLRMALTSKTNRSVTPEYINSLLSISPPCSGLSLGDLVKVIEHQGLFAEITDCTKLTRDTYISALAAAVESGHHALLVFTTDNSSAGVVADEHVVLVYGHTRHSDEWHPQAIPAYSGPSSAPYYPASSWIDHFLIHDDNFGPYFTLSSSALEFKPEVRAHWIVVIRDKAVTINAQAAEGVASSQLANIAPALKPYASGRWFDYIVNSRSPYVLRTVLISRDEYERHLAKLQGHDGSRVRPGEMQVLYRLPNYFWMVEFSLPPLFTGNHSKLGELLIVADAQGTVRFDEATLGLRVPSLMLLKSGGQGGLSIFPFGIESHVDIYRLKDHVEVW